MRPERAPAPSLRSVQDDAGSSPRVRLFSVCVRTEEPALHRGGGCHALQPQPYRRTRVGLRRPFTFTTLVTSTNVLSMGRLGGSVLVKWPTDTGSLAGNVPL